ncbi:MAG: hypothetical protein PHQ23_13570 [Candidatus Wallbacteria bacterium]|nr:hypothetical protein [Candidatus Wallbacteria bacterium]
MKEIYTVVPDLSITIDELKKIDYRKYSVIHIEAHGGPSPMQYQSNQFAPNEPKSPFFVVWNYAQIQPAEFMPSSRVHPEDFNSIPAFYKNPVDYVVLNACYSCMKRSVQIDGTDVPVDHAVDWKLAFQAGCVGCVIGWDYNNTWFGGVSEKGDVYGNHTTNVFYKFYDLLRESKRKMGSSPK